jgi:hypothetical protein
MGLGLGLLLALGAGAGISHLRHPEPVADVRPPPIPAPPHPAAPMAVPLPVNVALVFESDPPGAEVWKVRDGSGSSELLGTTPLRRSIPRSADEITFEIRLDGYDPMRVPTPATTDRTVNVSLKRSPPPKGNPVAKAARRHARRSQADDSNPYAREKTLDPFR